MVMQALGRLSLTRILLGVCAVLIVFPVTFVSAQTTLRAQRMDIMDPSGFGQPVPAFSILVPFGWQGRGGIVWGAADQCNTYGHDINWGAGSPDGTTGVAIFPSVRWTDADPVPGLGPPCKRLNVKNARELIEWIISNMNDPNARIIDYRARPDFLREAGLKSGEQFLGYMTLYTTVDAGEALVSTIENGRNVRYVIGLVMSNWTLREPHPGFREPITITGGTSLPGFLAAAPADKLNFRIIEMIRKSIAINPNWAREIAKHHAVIDRQNAKGAADRARISAQANAEISDIIHNGYLEREQIRDRGHRESIEAIRGVETYVEPNGGGTVQLDDSFRYAWQLQDGSYVLTDDEFFQPSSEFGVDGQRMAVAN